jgi:acetolactate decarboxylase
LKKYCCVYILAIVLLIASSCIVGCTSDNDSVPYASNPVASRETLTQISTIDAVLNGVYDGVMTYGTLKGYGDTGIGTFAALDGEMIAFDGAFYQIKADGKADAVTDNMETPFASVTFFDTDITGDIPPGSDFIRVQEFLDEIMPTENAFYAIRIDGTFSYMETRSVPAQVKPYPPLVEVTKNQPVFQFTEVKGTIIGFRCPPYAAGVNVTGYHLHFLTADKDAGGHVLDFTVKQATFYLDETPIFMMILPDKDSDFYTVDLTPDNQEELELAEQ